MTELAINRTPLSLTGHYIFSRVLTLASTICHLFHTCYLANCFFELSRFLQAYAHAGAFCVFPVHSSLHTWSLIPQLLNKATLYFSTVIQK